MVDVKYYMLQVYNIVIYIFFFFWSIPNSLTIPPPPFPPDNHKFVLWVCESVKLLLFFNIYLFILAVPGLSYDTWGLHCSLQTLTCSMQTLSCGMHVGFSSPTRDWTQAPCIGSMESYPLDHQGSLNTCCLVSTGP